MSLNLPFVKETRFGNWFLKTNMWKIRVLDRALNDLQRLMPARRAQYSHILDVGCGFGHSFFALAKRFNPQQITGLDADPDLQARASDSARNCPAQVRLFAGNASLMQGIPDNEFDMVFCHQTFHHIVDQEEAMAEFFRVLKPGGVLLFAESTKRYIHSLQIRLLFRHPMHVQKTAEEYIAIIRNAGFSLPDAQISLPFLWWSRPDAGLWEWIGFPLPKKREETLVNAVAIKPMQ
ncbi:class I SAM-dependent methyltransferase [Methylobacillus gramineus]|uniref:class I SAM-dependent methyltransferase n=1 Tax=Methylobacillus gramineus TaxID=755169 RepID=UPI001CFFF027|nr:class I SAM-dependent methyltransferase [Methylobacillus gramineus]MCB5183719.1 class I SAM-dependent methyltransferase [Methylobacillus gramineus]